MSNANPQTSYEINIPDVVRELEAQFAGYDRALAANDVEALNSFFFDAPSTVRFGIGENLYGHDEIKAFRSSVRPSGPMPPRERTVITTFGRDLGTVATTSKSRDTGKATRTMQTWVRLPPGWRIVCAHVSAIDAKA